MAQRKPWTQYEDRRLKFVFQSTKITKWSHIARILQTQYGVKGRNGKQCKERYATHIDPSYPKQEWSHQQELKMFELHNELGNKWAIIGTKCGGKTDSSVKNHFYSRLRKSLKKINQVLAEKFRKEYKEIKPSLLFKIVEVSEERFKLSTLFEKQFICFSNQLKNQLLDFSYDQEDKQDIQESSINIDVAKRLIEKLNQFGGNYKKKNKKERKSSGNEQDLLRPNRLETKGKRCHSQNEQNSQNNSFVNSSDVGNSEDISDNEINCNTLTVQNNSKQFPRNSTYNSVETIQVPRILTLANSNENINKQQKKKQQSLMKDQRFQQNNKDYLQGLQGLIQKEEYHFFQDSQMQMPILPEVQLEFWRDLQHDWNIFL